MYDLLIAFSCSVDRNLCGTFINVKRVHLLYVLTKVYMNWCMAMYMNFSIIVMKHLL